jgi:hypothetical protein
MSSSQKPRFSADSDPDALETFQSPLLTANGGRWTLAKEGEALEREFKFKTFAKTWVSYTPTLLSSGRASILQPCSLPQSTRDVPPWSRCDNEFN